MAGSSTQAGNMSVLRCSGVHHAAGVIWFGQMKSCPLEAESPGQRQETLSPLPHLAAVFQPRISAGSLTHGYGTGCGHNPWDKACCGPCAGSLLPAITHLCAHTPALLQRSRYLRLPASSAPSFHLVTEIWDNSACPAQISAVSSPVASSSSRFLDI